MMHSVSTRRIVITTELRMRAWQNRPTVAVKLCFTAVLTGRRSILMGKRKLTIFCYPFLGQLVSLLRPGK